MFKSLLAALLLTSASTSRLARAYAPCTKPQKEMSVEGVEGIFCVDDNPMCIADVSNGTCPGVQPGLPYGSYCGIVATNVYGCKVVPPTPTVSPTSTAAMPSVTPAPTTPATPAPVETQVPTTSTPVKTPSLTAGVIGATLDAFCLSGESGVSVEGVEGVFCVKGGPTCMGSEYNGICPGVENPRLPNGSYCGIVASGVYGCKVSTASAVEATPAPTSATPAAVSPEPTIVANVPAVASPAPATAANMPGSPSTSSDGSSYSCRDGETPVGVEGAQGIFCVNGGPLCSGTVSNGLCPGVQYPSLPLGSYCGVVAFGEYGCKVSPSTAPAPSTPSSPALPTGAASGSSTLASSVIISSSNCPSGESEMSVEGVKGFFCVAGGPLCSASLSNGLCPGKSDRLPVGSYCGILASGVYGCKILNANSLETLSPVVVTPTTTAPAGSPVSPVSSAPAASSEAPTTTPSLPTTASPADSTATSSDCPNGGTPMSVVGIPKVFCVPGVACAGTESNGACPTAEPALSNGAYCDIVHPGVYGCKPIV
ncbi:hypothetical protein FI667_g5333, partial [Globisporangium splendens]